MNALIRTFTDFGPGDRFLGLIIVASLSFAAFSISFVAAALVLRWRNLRKARRWNVLEERWEAELLDFIAGDITADALRTRISRDDSRYFIDYLTRFARRMRGSERKMVEELAAPYLPLIVRQLRSRQAATRSRAVRSLSLLGLKSYAPEIIGALDDASPIVAMTAARELSRRENPQYAPAVLLRLERFRDWSPAFLAAMLAGIGPDAATFLRGTLANERQPSSVRAVAADALRALNDLPAADVAATALLRERQRDVVAAALRLLKQCGNAKHATAIRPLAHNPDDLIRAQALSALGTLGDSRDVSTLTAALSDPSIWVASHAAQALLANAGRSVLDGIAASAHPRADLARQVLVEAS